MNTKLYNTIKGIIAALLIAMLVPCAVIRADNEGKNRNIVVSLLYNDIKMKLPASTLDEQLEKYRKIGVDTVTVQEEDLNSLINSGSITCIKYNVLLHRFDDESEAMIKKLSGIEKISNDSYILITKRDFGKQFLKKWLPLKYGSDEYKYVKFNAETDIYVIYSGEAYAHQISVGFNEEQIEYLYNKNFNIALSVQVKNYSQQGYLDEFQKIIDKYNVKYLIIKDDYRHPEKETDAKANYNGISKLISKNNMVLVVTENADQLSNEKPIGYKKIFDDNKDNVIRSYETYIVPGGDPTEYMFRYYQYLNSTIDRNIRFINVTQITSATKTYLEQNYLTQKAVKKYVDKINTMGYNTHHGDEGFQVRYDYSVNRRAISAIALVIMGLMLLTMLEWLIGKKYKLLIALAAAGCVLGVGATFVLPMSLVELYPSLFAVLAPCFCLTAVFVYAKEMKGILKTMPFIISTMLLALISLSFCGLVQGALLSGIDYYINFAIFRGIKLSLYVPMLYAMPAYYLLFMRKDNKSVFDDIKLALMADIKVYWVLIAAAFAYVGMVYITRSGNVNQISSLENAMRTFITENFPARPRTKEFIAWPCLMLFLYYIKERKNTLVSFVFAVGSSILFASVINSFCHVFTNFTTIYIRVFLGAFFSLFICAAVYVLNKPILKIVDKITKREKNLYEQK